MIRNLRDIVHEIKHEEFILSRHAYIRSIERNITIEQIIESANNIEIIEEYPDDKYSPTCLLLAFTNSNQENLLNPFNQGSDNLILIQPTTAQNPLSWFLYCPSYQLQKGLKCVFPQGSAHQINNRAKQSFHHTEKAPICHQFCH